jgi:putative NADPH-quinone reductase
MEEITDHKSMKKIVAFNGSPRPTGNTSHLLGQFMKGASENQAEIEVLHPQNLKLEYCTGCLRCNMLRRCSIRDDDWPEVSAKILNADVLVFAAPVYFHHVPAPMKAMLDRFRSFIHVQITETGLQHTPWHIWNKDFVLILSLGSSDAVDADPVIELFRFMTSILGEGNRLHIVTATRLAVVKQVVKTEAELRELYEKMRLSPDLAPVDVIRNQKVLDECRELGARIGSQS